MKSYPHARLPKISSCHIIIYNMTTKTLLSVLLLGLVAAGIWFAQKTRPENSVPISDPYAVVASRDSSTGSYLTDMQGKTLYVFLRDKNLESACKDECLAKWPIFEFNNKDLSRATDPLSKNINVIKRSDGMYQYAYAGKPLYYYVGDANPGDKNGEGFNNSWYTVILP